MPKFTVLLEKTFALGSMPPELIEAYGGGLDFLTPHELRPYVYSNFVTTLDGMVTFGIEGESEGRVVSMKSQDDQWLMALLRASADAVIVGAGTLRAEKSHTWTVDALKSVAPAPFVDWRRASGRLPQPLQCFVTASGNVDKNALVFRDGDLEKVIFTTEHGAKELGDIPAEIVVSQCNQVDLSAAMRFLREEKGVRNLLTEGGPRLYGELLSAGLVDESFQTLSPQMAGVGRGAKARYGLTEGACWNPDKSPKAELLSARVGECDGDHLFLRYRIKRPD